MTVGCSTNDRRAASTTTTKDLPPTMSPVATGTSPSTTTSTSLPLLPSPHHPKTIDLGADGLCASIHPRSGLLINLISNTHPQHGQVLVAGWPQFPAERYWDQAYVREYRKRPVQAFEDGQGGWGWSVGTGDDDEHAGSWSYVDAAWPCTTRSHELSTTFTIESGPLLRIRTQASSRRRLRIAFHGSTSLHRAAYTQLTPQGDCSIPDVENQLSVRGGGEDELVLENRHLASRMSCRVVVDGKAQRIACQTREPSALPITPDISPIDVEASCVDIIYQLHMPSRSDSLSSPVSRPTLLQPRLSALLGPTLSLMVARNLDYLLGCCLVPISSSSPPSLCVITDHQCLPLGWNRDNYWQLRLLAVLYPRVDELSATPDVWRQLIQSTLAQHLVWVYQVAQRPLGYWARCFYTNGVPKDKVFQLDQQCYPLLELAEYADMFDGDDLGLAPLVDAALDAILTQRHPTLWLFKTAETPADDEVEYPYHFSSHVLLWRTLVKLADLQRRHPDAIKTDVAAWARDVRAATLEHFTADGMFAYLTSTTGSYQFYHDANDLPTILAPRWGFCTADDPRWIKTTQWAFSTANKDGFFPGTLGGLGSVHTKHPWPLGDVQELILCDILGDSDRRTSVLAKLERCIQQDGMLPEAINVDTGAVESKHWFSWPGTFAAQVLLETHTEDVLTAHVMSEYQEHRRRQHQEQRGGPLMIGLQGPQGCGKTFLTRRLVSSLAARGLRTIVFSSDDLYLDYEGLRELAARNPSNAMLQGRGPPGTHDIALGVDILARLGAGEDVSIPVFDKHAYSGFGDRAPRDRWQHVTGPVDVVVFEGWCMGFEALSSDDELAKRLASSRVAKQHSLASIQQLNSALARYSAWHAALSSIIRIVPPTLDVVYAWRLEAEHAMKRLTGSGMTDDEVRRFVDRYMPTYELFDGPSSLDIRIDASRRHVAST